MLIFKQITRFFALFDFRMKRSDFYRDLGEMFSRSEPMLSFLEGEIANARHTKQHSRAAALRQILQRLQSGENAGRLGFLLGGIMPASDAMMLVAVDRSADKPAALEALAEAVDNQNAMKRMVASYAALPLAMIPLCYALMALLSQVIIAVQESAPAYLQKELWRGFNGVAKVIAEFTYHHGPIAFSLFLTLVIGIMLSLPRWKGMLRLRVENWPVFSLYRDFQAGLLLTSLAMLLQTGCTLKAAIEDVSTSSSRWLRWHLRRVLAALDDNPNAMIEAFGRGLLSPYMLSRAATLRRSAPTFSDVLVELGTKEGPRVLNRVKATAITANVAVVGVLFFLSGVMAIASMTVPSRFSSLMEPTSRMMLQSMHQSEVPDTPRGAQP